MGKKPIVVINKVDKPNCRPDEVQEEVFDLMCNLNATEEQLAYLTDIFVNCSRYELGFWDMSWELRL